MAKPRMIGMNKTYVPNSKADQMKKRFKRKGRNRRYTPSEIEITPYEVGDTIRIPLPKDKKIMTYEGEEIDFDYGAEDE